MHRLKATRKGKEALEGVDECPNDSSVWLTDSCTVCLGDFEGEDIVRRLPCQHLFHTNCVDIWLESTGTCPTCRGSIVPMAPGEAQPHHLEE
mmetsp:Transcript_12630/g.35514  ORF Transcript_12630/g.35514 Transcript_12630/m.35514 type:complete len:92 (-) Transcript_12630:189-464(-)